MWHPIKRVAENRFLDAKVTEGVAVRDKDKFHIIDMQINTLYVDAFVDAVKIAQGGHEASEGVRNMLIEIMKIGNKS